MSIALKSGSPKYIIILFLISMICFFSCTNNKPLPDNYKNPIGIEFVKVTSGGFMMGSKITPTEIFNRYAGDSAWFKNEYPQHKVIITQPFMIGKFEITKGQFAKFIQETKYITDVETSHKADGWNGNKRVKRSDINWKNSGYTQDSTHPVVCVTWKDAMKFIEWLNQNYNTIGDDYMYDLPTEAEWEYTCRAGSDALFFWGDNEGDGINYCNLADSAGAKSHEWKEFFHYNDHYSESCPVGSFKPNKFGIYDMVGNVYEWTKDSGENDAEFFYKTLEKDPFNDGNGKTHMLRGGSWHSNQRGARSSKRKAYSIETAGDNIGFRVVIRLKD